MDERQVRATTWFRELRDSICAEFEALEREAPEDLYPGDPGTFEYTDWQRQVENGGGGTGGMRNEPPWPGVAGRGAGEPGAGAEGPGVPGRAGGSGVPPTPPSSVHLGRGPRK